MAVYMSVQEGGVLTARITGEIDHHSAGWLRMDIDTAINDRHPKVLRLDFSGVSFMDSSGVGLILGRYRLVSGWSGEVCVANLPPQLERLVSLAGIRELCTVVGPEEDRS